MIRLRLFLFLVPSFVSAFEADARRGESIFSRYQCTTCHSTSANQNSAPNLSRRLDREYSPAGMASRMWNHAPKMWLAMKEAGIALPSMSEADAADLFAFYYSTRYFERRGDAARGSKVFFEKNCIMCHAINGPEKPAREWRSLADPVELVNSMWNHAPEMQAATQRRDYRWPTISSQEMTDLLVYLQNLPETRKLTYQFALPDGSQGKQLMEDKGCTACHKGAMSLENRLGGLTLTEVASGMWNHAPEMRKEAKPLSSTELREILAYAWAKQFFQSKGQPDRGAKLFKAQCAGCHSNPASGAPDLSKRKLGASSITMVSALWRHGPRMLSELQAAGKPWPVLNPADMANLIAFLRK